MRPISPSRQKLARTVARAQFNVEFLGTHKGADRKTVDSRGRHSRRMQIGLPCPLELFHQPFAPLGDRTGVCDRSKQHPNWGSFMGNLAP